MEPLRVAIIDDEPLARNRLGRLLRDSGCQVLAELEDAPSLLAWLEEKPQVDALFLDIQMPGGSGLEVIAELQNPPQIVLVTAYSEHAIRAFELAVTDYLLKPVYAERLGKAIERIRALQITRTNVPQTAKPPAPPPRLTVKAGEGRLFLDLKHVSHFEVVEEIVWAKAAGKRFRTQWSTLLEVEEAFPDAGMVKIQRHILLRPEAVKGFRPLPGGRIKVRIGDQEELEVSRTMTPRLKERLDLE